MNEFREFDGTVVEFSWRNPHVFIVIDVDGEPSDDSRLLLEMNSRPILADMGWSADSLSVGDTIHVRGNPDRRSSRRQLFVRYVELSSGERLWSFGRPRSESSDPVSSSTPTRNAELPPGSDDFTGTWSRARLTPAQRAAVDNEGPARWPVTAEGAKALETFKSSDDPTYRCVPVSMPDTIVPVYPMRISRPSDDLLFIEYEFNNGYREIHLGTPEFPERQEPSHMGYSIGTIDNDNVLTIRTKFFSEEPWGNGRGLPSSTQKQVFEKYSLVRDGRRLEVEYSTIDPAYLLGPPITRSAAYILANDTRFSDFDCDPGTAIRHLTGE